MTTDTAPGGAERSERVSYADRVKALSREERIALLAYRQGHLLASVHLNMGKDAIAVYNKMQDTLIAMETTDADLMNEVADRIDRQPPS